MADMAIISPARTEDTLPEAEPHCTTIEAARRLGLAVRSVQLMVDRGELQAWRTPGGHRRISLDSLERWIARQAGGHVPPQAHEPSANAVERPRVLLIEDSVHYQNLVSRLMAQRFPAVELHVAGDGVVGLAMYGRLLPQVLLVDILLPGIDGATLITSLSSHQQFAGSQLIVVTSLDEVQREPYRFALEGIPVVHKPRLVVDLPPLLEHCLAALPEAATPA